MEHYVRGIVMNTDKIIVDMDLLINGLEQTNPLDAKLARSIRENIIRKHNPQPEPQEVDLKILAGKVAGELSLHANRGNLDAAREVIKLLRPYLQPANTSKLLADIKLLREALNHADLAIPNSITKQIIEQALALTDKYEKGE